MRRLEVPTEYNGQPVLDSRIRSRRTEILVDCPGGHGPAWRSLASIRAAGAKGCRKCSSDKKRVAHQRLNVGDILRKYQVIEVRPDGLKPKNGAMPYKVKNITCGHERVIYDYAKYPFTGDRALCGCPNRRTCKDGYVKWEWRAPTGKWLAIAEHRIVMEQKLGRELLPGENVHHINGVRDDNRPENLELWSTSQPYGQRVEDKIKWCREFLAQYEEICA